MYVVAIVVSLCTIECLLRAPGSQKKPCMETSVRAPACSRTRSTLLNVHNHSVRVLHIHNSAGDRAYRSLTSRVRGLVRYKFFLRVIFVHWILLH